MKQYQPGSKVPSSGVYIVFHPEHRLVHESTITRGSCFPQCRICGTRVTFQLWKSAEADGEGSSECDRSILVPFSVEAEDYQLLAI